MGCPWSRPASASESKADVYSVSKQDRASLVDVDDGEGSPETSPQNGHSHLNRRDTPAKGLLNPDRRNTSKQNTRTSPALLTSNSQHEFFRMLEEKIAQGPGELTDSDAEQ
ncbi:unnamed protein product [Bursaphelenchus xylophilus]|uniref:(pine wood nematode) hypothetical protein n=1 Tax=Bursaphelenchus xylophilus TaxID=6326 RepID=A0A1I7SMD9_BURXY|nr:unnamed protein product [Bursaphelenchus xylophilus]CAG9130140.1 unnamed protein product [Bursaphelenchus xylophilus]